MKIVLRINSYRIYRWNHRSIWWKHDFRSSGRRGPFTGLGSWEWLESPGPEFGHRKLRLFLEEEKGREAYSKATMEKEATSWEIWNARAHYWNLAPDPAPCAAIIHVQGPTSDEPRRLRTQLGAEGGGRALYFSKKRRIPSPLTPFCDINLCTPRVLFV